MIEDISHGFNAVKRYFSNRASDTIISNFSISDFVGFGIDDSILDVIRLLTIQLDSASPTGKSTNKKNYSKGNSLSSHNSSPPSDSPSLDRVAKYQSSDDAYEDDFEDIEEEYDSNHGSSDGEADVAEEISEEEKHPRSNAVHRLRGDNEEDNRDILRGQKSGLIKLLNCFIKLKYFNYE
jgi:hypothetical protein